MYGKTNWIWLNSWNEQEQAHPGIVYFRKAFLLDGAVSQAEVKVSADSRYRLLVNGTPVGFGPCKGDAYRWYADTIDLKPYLHAGENVLAAIVLRYPVAPKSGNESVWRTPFPGFFLQGAARLANGTEIPLSADDTWRASRTAHVGILPDGGLNFLWIREETRGESTFEGWDAPGYADDHWETPQILSSFFLPGCVSPGSVEDRPTPPMYEHRKRFVETVVVREGAPEASGWTTWLRGEAPITLAAHSRTVVEIDAGELTTGFLELMVSGGSSATLHLLSAESYAYPPEDPDSRHPMPVKKDRTDWRNGSLYGMTDRYQVSGHGTSARPEKYEPFWFRTFRYLQLAITAGETPLTLLGLTYRETGYPLEAVTRVATSSAELSDIWDISLRTLRRCMHETYEDCPFYEQLQYAMDTRSQILFTYAVSADDRLARKCIDDFHRSQYPNGLVSSCYPAYGHNIIPGFSLYYLLMLHDHMMYFGDSDFLRTYLPTMDAVLAFFERNRNADGIVGKIGGPLGGAYWSFVDWTREWRGTLGVPTVTADGPITYESLLYAYVLKACAEVADWLGRPEQGVEYRSRAASVLEAVNRCCRGRDGLYQDGPGADVYAQHCQVMAVLSGAVEGAEARRLMEIALEDTTLAQCSVAMAHYLFRAVEQTGLYGRTEALWQPWRDMLADHLTTCVEDPVSGRSDCHAWGAIALYELPSVLLGVRPAKPGYAAVRIAPQPAMLTHAEGEVITPKGMVRVAWEKTNEGMVVRKEVPEGMEIVD